jgi:RNA polymerase sigma-70 factor (ECF subfamily)
MTIDEESPMMASLVQSDAHDDPPRGPIGLATDSDDAKIHEAIAAGDHRRALVLCARSHGDAIGRFGMALLGSQADADDVTQETLLAAHDGFASWRGEGSLRAWLFTIARRKCARLLEQRARRTAKLRLVHDAEKQADSGAEREMLMRERAERARLALEAVKPSERDALLLRFGAGLSYRDVAQACGIDEVAARKRVSRALIAMKEALASEGSAS